MMVCFIPLRSLKRALDRRLYLLLYGNAYGSSNKPCWHFPEKAYESEETMRKCAESALKSVIGDLSHTYFVGNSPMAHMIVQHTEEMPESPSFKNAGGGPRLDWWDWPVSADQLASVTVLDLPLVSQSVPDASSFLHSSDSIRFFFKSQVVCANKYNVGKCKDHVWVTKDELLEYLPEQAAFFNQMIIS
ncbi:hypothetical protein Taro_049111 [Colocasia esculenta]|uniref:Uncharacterized protein n=1 Tax=Colocasia esculenta TaxID=4460 RepID=A0A843XA47_COLES|nr:hypothetical protein [Colocasia esculenta]